MSGAPSFDDVQAAARAVAIAAHPCHSGLIRIRQGR